jgi:protocatechuate 3,4-dioxygenase, alpha subunit
MSGSTLTAAQTVGPFFHPAMLREDMPQNSLAQPGISGERIHISGRVTDGEGAPVPDAVIEVWQANSHGRYNHPADTRDAPLEAGFTGFARAGTDVDGRYWFDTVKPGAVPFSGDRMQAPHICLTIFARGLLHHLLTRLYFEDEPANADDPILGIVPKERRGTMIARRVEVKERATYVFDIVLQGEGETVFLNPVVT